MTLVGEISPYHKPREPPAETNTSGRRDLYYFCTIVSGNGAGPEIYENAESITYMLSIP